MSRAAACGCAAGHVAFGLCRHCYDVARAAKRYAREREAAAILRRLRPAVEGARLARAAMGDGRPKRLLVEVRASGGLEAWWQAGGAGEARVVWLDEPGRPSVRVRLPWLNAERRCGGCGDVKRHHARGLCSTCHDKLRGVAA